MADVDPALGQEILEVSQRQWVPDVHHHDQTDHFWRAVEISEWAAHGPELPRSEAARRIALTPFGSGMALLGPLFVRSCGNKCQQRAAAQQFGKEIQKTKDHTSLFQ